MAGIRLLELVLTRHVLAEEETTDDLHDFRWTLSSEVNPFTSLLRVMSCSSSWDPTLCLVFPLFEGVKNLLRPSTRHLTTFLGSLTATAVEVDSEGVVVEEEVDDVVVEDEVVEVLELELDSSDQGWLRLDFDV